MNTTPNSEIKAGYIENSLQELFGYITTTEDPKLGRLTRQLQSNIECFIADSTEEFNELADSYTSLNEQMDATLNKVDIAKLELSTIKSTIASKDNAHICLSAPTKNYFFFVQF